MSSQTPIDRAVATYCDAWQTACADSAGFAQVDPETLAEQTAADFTFRYIDIGSVTSGRIDWATVPTLPFEDAPSRARRVIRTGDTLISTVRPLLGSHTYAEWVESAPTVGSTGFAVLRCQDGLLPNFVKHLPFAEQVSRQLVAWQCGTSYPAVNKRDIRRLVLPAPSLDEQSAIARILDEIDRALDLTLETNKEARRLKRAVLDDFLYGALGDTAYADRPRKELPKSWSLVHTERLLSSTPQNGISPPSSVHPPGTPTFSIAAVRDGAIDLERVEHLKYVRVDEKILDRYRIRRGDTLVVRGNASPDLVGKAGKVTSFPAGCIYPDITKRIVFRKLAEGGVHPDFALLAWNHPVVHNQLLRRAKTSNGTLKINNRDVARVVLPLPGEKEQERLVEAANAVQMECDELSAQVTALKRLKAGVMHDLLTGRVRVDVPAVAS